MAYHRHVAAVAAVLAAGLCGRSPAQTTGPTTASPVAPTTAPAVTLGVGDPAPALRVMRWYKGQPVPAFQPGHAYVVEFWATWCVPCKVSIPRLTALQKQYGDKVTVIGIDVLEVAHSNEAIAKLAAPFVARMGDQMDYTVGGDGTDRFMHDHWLAAAGETGIPTAFVVMPDGRVGWIGHPSGLDAVLPRVVAGTWDVTAERARRDTLAAAERPHAEARARIIPLYKAKDWAGVIAARDAAVARTPGLAKSPDLVSFAVEAMFDADPKRAVAYVGELYGPGGPVAAGAVSSWDVFRVLPLVPAEGPMARADWQAVVDRVRTEAEHTTKAGFGHFTGYADLLWRAGDLEQAKVYQEKGVKVLAAWNDAHKATLVPGNLQQLQEQEGRLKVMNAGQPYAAIPQPAKSNG